MTKRMFFKLSAAILGASSAARLFGGTPDEPTSGGPLTNWAGNYRYGTDNLHRLSSIEEVQKVRQGARIAQGAWHPPLLQRHR